ncbi:arylsulfatase [Algoriphagus aquaeductus]|uniref:Arylsulfatase n=1 Tax=Algoriphagus aquaeductus TaxID=475299 RepID=A0A326RPT2_9BACT|nr:arylsulfatase [Algoriphagus aquaeductus]
MKSAGYRTLWAGKHHGGDHPLDRGFDRYYGLMEGASNHFNPGPQREGESQPAQKRPDRPFYIDRILHQPYPVPNDYYSTDYFTKYAIDWLEEYQAEQKPFFLYLSYTAPHDPLMAWPEDIAKYRGTYSEGYEIIRQRRFEKQKALGIIHTDHTLTNSTHVPWSSLSDSLRRIEEQKMEVYAAMIDRMDQKIGEIIQKLRDSGKLENTVFIFLSDNGASGEVVKLPGDGKIGGVGQWTSLGEDWANVGNTPLRFFKNYSFEGGIKTPLIISWPTGLGHQNEINSFPSHLIDIMPTMAELANADYPTSFLGKLILPWEGESLLPAIRKGKIQRETPIFWEWSIGKAVRKGDWKLVAHGKTSPWELYDLKNDPYETKNLTAQFPEITRVMEALFLEWKVKVSKVPSERMGTQ